MQALYDFFPIIVFGIVYYFFGIYWATASIIAASTLQVIYHYFRFQRFEMIQVATMLLVWILGGATLIFHNVMFIKWKPSVIYFLFALVLIGYQIFSKESPLKKILGKKISLPEPIWSRLSLIWAVFFIVMAILNLIIAYHFSTKTWVYFKVIGTLVLTFLFVIGQAIYLNKYIEPKKEEKSQ